MTLHEILDEHKQDFDLVRRLCLECHGLDLTSNYLYSNTDDSFPSRNTSEILGGMISSCLLNLTVAIRINIYQGKIDGKKERLGLIEASYYEDDDLMLKQTTVKDVCDKIIHANSVSMTAFPFGDRSSGVLNTVQFKGTYQGKNWTLDLCMEVFAESVLRLLDRIEEGKA